MSTGDYPGIESLSSPPLPQHMHATVAQQIPSPFGLKPVDYQCRTALPRGSIHHALTFKIIKAHIKLGGEGGGEELEGSRDHE